MPNSERTMTSIAVRKPYLSGKNLEITHNVAAEETLPILRALEKIPGLKASMGMRGHDLAGAFKSATDPIKMASPDIGQKAPSVKKGHTFKPAGLGR